ncbi:putative leucine-rich repeat-containing protein DDB_G0290503 [Zingiber officinale]|uniref:Uncharacterized protein n=1 Tax=Zingiber officinale TaxID=94328 RepID=A0A8J5GXA2_ZINOF|nr:putative leucine-rich repeat-containing protein DDB_G0290503 [Zingiber officinale]KAG6513463.1 hypothetical protein ZIOFF_023793 [Zingiber officinale]
MAEVSQASSGETEVKLSGKDDTEVGENTEKVFTKGNNDVLSKEEIKEEEESALDGEFVKVEKELLVDVKESSHLPKVELEESKLPASNQSGKSESTIDSPKLVKEIDELKLQIATLLGKLNSLETEKASMKSKLDLANEELEKMNKHCEEFELDQKLLKNQIIEAEQKYNLQIESHQEALKATDMKHKELVDLKESFTGLSTELESSKNMIKSLEEELLSSTNELHKLNEASKHSSSQAELESRKVKELESTLELTHATAKSMKDQINNLQKELSDLDGKIAEKHQIEEKLQNTLLELSKFQEKLEASKLEMAKLEQDISSKDALVQELTEERNLHKVAEEKLKSNLTSLQVMLSASERDMRTKCVSLGELEQKLQEQVKERERVEALFKDREIQILKVKDDLTNLIAEKATLESTVSDLNTKLSEHEELYRKLEAKLSLSEQNFRETNSLLSQTSTYKEELEKKLELFEQLHHESKTTTEACTRRNLELEGLIQASSAVEENIRSQLKDCKLKLASAEKSNVDLEQQINLSEIKFLDAQNEINELNEKIKELTSSLKEAAEENALSRHRLEGYEDKINQLDSSLTKSSLSKLELEKELNDLINKCTEHEERATATQNRSLELEELINSSDSRAKDAQKRVEEVELLLEAANYHTQELVQLISIEQSKQRDVEAESKQYKSKVTDLVTELEAHQTRTKNLEAVLQAANEKEKELTNVLNTAIEERKKFEDLSNSQQKKLIESETQIQILQNELKYMTEKLESVQKQLEASNLQEKDLSEKLRYAEEQLTHHGKTVEEITARNLDLKFLTESLTKESEMKLEEAAVNLKQKDSEVKELLEKLHSLEEQLNFYKEQVVESTENAASLKSELEEKAVKLVSLENNIEELKQKLSEANIKGEQTISENELLSMTNSKLREELEVHQHKINELNDLLKSTHSEKETIAVQLASHTSTITKLTEEHSRGLDLQLAIESRLNETEAHLNDSVEKYKLKDLEASELNEKLLATETKLRIYEEQASELATQKGKLEEALFKIQDLGVLIEQLKSNSHSFQTENEGLVRQNISLAEHVATFKTKMNDLQVAFDATTAEKEDLMKQLHYSKKESDDSIQLLNTEKDVLKFQVSSHLEEGKLLKEMHEKLRNEHETSVAQLERELSQQKVDKESLSSLVDNLRAELAEKSLLQERASELEEKLLLAEKAYAQEVAEENNKVTVLKVELEELKLKQNQTSAMEKKIVELENTLQLVHTANDNQIKNATQVERDDSTEVKSREIGLDTSTLSKRKNKKSSDRPKKDTETTNVSRNAHLAAEHSEGSAFKFVLGVALVSIIIGIILGKRY